METVFDGEIAVHYGYAFVGAAVEPPDLLDTRRGQANGLCGAAIPGVLSLVTGLHTGDVPLRIEWLDGPPPLEEDSWQDIVEVSFVPSQTALAVWTFHDLHPVTIPEVTTLRARYSIAGMDAGNEMDTRIDTPAVEQALLQLWPAPPEKDTILRSNSQTGAYWHREAESLSF